MIQTFPSSQLFGLMRVSAAVTLLITIVIVPLARAQNSQMQEQIVKIDQSIAQNEQVLSKYNWQELDTVTAAGVLESQEAFRLQVGPYNRLQKKELSTLVQSGSGYHYWNTEDYRDYDRQVAELAQVYLRFAPGEFSHLYEQGNLTVGPSNTAGEVPIFIQSYLKQGDSVALIYSTAQQVILSVEISSYLSYINVPSTAVNISARFAQLLDGPNHVFNVVVNGPDGLTVEIQNSNYSHL